MNANKTRDSVCFPAQRAPSPEAEAVSGSQEHAAAGGQEAKAEGHLESGESLGPRRAQICYIRGPSGPTQALSTVLLTVTMGCAFRPFHCFSPFLVSLVPAHLTFFSFLSSGVRLFLPQSSITAIIIRVRQSTHGVRSVTQKDKKTGTNHCILLS